MRRRHAGRRRLCASAGADKLAARSRPAGQLSERALCAESRHRRAPNGRFVSPERSETGWTASLPNTQERGGFLQCAVRPVEVAGCAGDLAGLEIYPQGRLPRNHSYWDSARRPPASTVFSDIGEEPRAFPDPKSYGDTSRDRVKRPRPLRGAIRIDTVHAARRCANAMHPAARLA